ncbi:MAG: FtsQ-type POTRA domain-containing protein [Bacillota bacterium]
MALLAACLLFQVKSFEIEKENDFNVLSESSIYDVLYQYKGQSIILLDESELITAMSLKLPYANVLNVERVFPSTLVLNIEERAPFFAIYEDSKYYLFDSENYFLGTSEDRDIESTVVIINGYVPDNLDSLVAGEIAVFEGKEEEIAILNEYFGYMLTLDFEYTEFQTTYFIKEIEVSYAGDIYITTRLGVEMVIYETSNNLAQKVQYLMGAYTPDELAILTGQTIYIGDNLTPTLSV